MTEEEKMTQSEKIANILTQAEGELLNGSDTSQTYIAYWRGVRNTVLRGRRS